MREAAAVRTCWTAAALLSFRIFPMIDTTRQDRSKLRFAAYLRLSTTDKQDPALSFPSQRKACERKVAELGGEVSCEFTDQESGAKDERPGWSALTPRPATSRAGALTRSSSTRPRASPATASTPPSSSAN